MVQTLRPNSDVSGSGWNKFGAATFYECVDEGLPGNDTTDFVHAIIGNAVRLFGIEAGTNPGASIPHIIRVRAAHQAIPDPTIRVRLLEGGVERAAHTFTVNVGTFQTEEYTLSTAEADSISDYTNLTLELKNLVPGYLPGGSMFVTLLELEIVDPPRMVPLRRSRKNPFPDWLRNKLWLPKARVVAVPEEPRPGIAGTKRRRVDRRTLVQGRGLLRSIVIPDPPAGPYTRDVITIRKARAAPSYPDWMGPRRLRWGRVDAEPPPGFQHELALKLALDILATETYRVIARNLATGAETVLGEGTTILGVAIADGDYMLRVETDGHFWRQGRFLQEWPLSIVGGEIAGALPEILGLLAQTVESSVEVTFNADPAMGTTTPDDFGVWVGASSPVSTAGAPDATTTYRGPGGYLVELVAAPTLLYVAVAARSGATVGPVAEAAVAGVETVLDAPDNQSARQPDGDWTQTENL
ncbi:MAG: hypothetical protein V2A76_00940 [Planctomycetota bacterium]